MNHGQGYCEFAQSWVLILLMDSALTVNLQDKIDYSRRGQQQADY